MRMEILNMVMI